MESNNNIKNKENDEKVIYTFLELATKRFSEFSHWRKLRM